MKLWWERIFRMPLDMRCNALLLKVSPADAKYDLRRPKDFIIQSGPIQLSHGLHSKKVVRIKWFLAPKRFGSLTP